MIRFDRKTEEEIKILFSKIAKNNNIENSIFENIIYSELFLLKAKSQLEFDLLSGKIPETSEKY